MSESAGLLGHWQGLSATWWDYDADGWIDLYVTNDFFGPDHLYHNNRNGTFTDVIAEAVPNTPWFSMGSDAGDLDGDGRLDLIAADMAATTHYKQKVKMGDMDAEGWFLEMPSPRQYMRNAVYINTGTPRFSEVAQMAGLAATDWTWAVKISDFDCDGRNDVFFSNGMTRDFFNADVRAEVRAIRERTGENRWSEYPQLTERNRLFRNLGNLDFDDVSEKWGFDRDTVSFGAATGDLDGDGDLDLVVNHFQEAVGVYRNTSVSGNVIKLVLRGEGANHQAIGAEVRAVTDQGELVRLLQPVRGFMGCDSAEVLFGIGEETSVKKLVIRWPSGNRQH
ncbi:MAG: CRTAC1 family protein, partial [Verrucomicrobiales bacterium]